MESSALAGHDFASRMASLSVSPGGEEYAPRHSGQFELIPRTLPLIGTWFRPCFLARKPRGNPARNPSIIGYPRVQQQLFPRLDQGQSRPPRRSVGKVTVLGPNVNINHHHTRQRTSEAVYVPVHSRPNHTIYTIEPNSGIRGVRPRSLRYQTNLLPSLG